MPLKRPLRYLVLDYVLLSFGSILQALSVVIFLAPFEIAPSGVSGLAVILNSLVGTATGLMIFLMNIPIQLLAFRMLPNGLRTIWLTMFCVVVYSVGIDALTPYFPAQGISDDRLLNAIFGGIIGGLSAGICYRIGGNFGGTSTLALIIQQRLGTPMSMTYLYTDMAVVVVAGFVYGWEGALYATVVIFISGLATDYVLEGPSVIKTAVIITDKPQEIADAIIERLGRGVTGWQGRGMYTQQPRTVLYVTVSRSQVESLRRIVVALDEHAFLVIGQGHTAYGQGFKPIAKSQKG
jgi:uncharacterized membrane-anchored protein YitT (DUF2179 family)